MDMYGLGLSGVTPEYSAELRRLQQQQMIAQSMMAQGQEQESNNQMAGGYVIPNSPLNGLNKVLQSYLGTKMMMQGNDGYKALGDKYQADQTAAIDKVKSAMAPTPAVPIPMANANGVQGDMIERPMADKRAAVQEAMLSQFPNVRNYGTTLNSNMQADQTREDNQVFRTQEAQLNREQRQHERDLAVEERKRQEVIQAQVREEQRKHQMDMKDIAAKQGSSPFFNFLPGENGYLVGNARTGQVTPAQINGQPVIKASDSPTLQGQIAGAKEGGKVTGKATAEAAIDLPTAVDKASQASAQIDELLTHPGFSSTVGATLKPGARLVDGTPEADFMKRLDQLKGGAFLQAFETLKGGGQITEVEGTKATAAITRMDKAQSEKEFTAAAREFQGIIKQGVTRAQKKAGAPVAGGFDAGKEQRYQAWKKSQGL